MLYTEFRAIQNKLDAYPRASNGLTLDAHKDANWLPLMRRMQALGTDPIPN